MCRKITAAMEMANRSAHCPIARNSVASGQRPGRRNTSSAPTVMPNMAIEIAMNAKWYHMVSENTRVSSTSNITVASATRNSAGRSPRIGSMSVRRDARRLDEPRVVLQLLADHRLELLEAQVQRIDAELFHAVLHVGLRQRRSEFAVEAPHDLARRFRRHERADPEVVVGVRIARLDGGRQVREERRALRRADRERLNSAFLRVRNDGKHG